MSRTSAESEATFGAELAAGYWPVRKLVRAVEAAQRADYRMTLEIRAAVWGEARNIFATDGLPVPAGPEAATSLVCCWDAC